MKLIDFGLAVRCDGDTQPMEPVGSIAIMAPELIRDHTGGRHTDWWAYGVLAFELLTGRSPWSTMDDVQQMSYEILNVNFKPPRTRSQTAGGFICKLLTRDFRERLGTTIKDPENIVRNSPFFKGVNWDKFAAQRNKPAFIPRHGRAISDTERTQIMAIHRSAVHDMQPSNFEEVQEEEEEEEGGDTIARLPEGSGGGGAVASSADGQSNRKKRVFHLGYPDVSEFLVP
jgi:serine/threonine protein kinase